MAISRRQFAQITGGVLLAHTFRRLAGAAPASSEPTSLTDLTLADCGRQIRSGKTSSLELTRACLSRIETYEPKLTSFITVMKEEALAQARLRDDELRKGVNRGPLHGIPVSLKDNIDTAGTRTTAASAVFEDRVPTEDATVTKRLLDAGAVLIGKNNMHEFAMGGGEVSYWGPARNPWALERNTGGSSSGGGAAVAAGLCFGALGTDTGGSIRIPASYCGIVGFKPTYGLVPIRGIIPLRVSMDHCGPMTRTAEDSAILLNAIAGYDKYDITSAERPKEDYVAGMRQPVNALKLGMPVGYFDGLQSDVANATQSAIALLGKLTAGVKEVVLPRTIDLQNGGASPSAETWAYHEQYYKHPAVAVRYMLPERRRLEAMSSINGGNAADVIRQRWALDLLRRTIDDAFTDFDLVVLPTQLILPPTLDELIAAAKNSNVPNNPAGTTNTPQFDVFGIPTISIPCGFSPGGLPIGLMIAGPRYSESRVLAVAHAYQQATDWHLRRPPLTPEMPVPTVMTF